MSMWPFGHPIYPIAPRDSQTQPYRQIHKSRLQSSTASLSPVPSPGAPNSPKQVLFVDFGAQSVVFTYLEP